MTTLSLELSKELQSVCKEKNIEMHESYFYWWKDCQEAHKGNPPVFEISHEQPDHGWQPIAPAYTLDELLEWLPNKIEKGTATYFKTLMHNYNKEYLAYYDDGNCGWIPSSSFFQFDPNPCDACGKLLIWLVKEGYVK